MVQDLVHLQCHLGLDVMPYERWPWLEHHGIDDYRFPAGRPRVPLVYSVRARR